MRNNIHESTIFVWKIPIITLFFIRNEDLGTTSKVSYYYKFDKKIVCKLECKIDFGEFEYIEYIEHFESFLPHE